jgi:hypothetical protein
MTQPTTCPKCSGRMEPGFIRDRAAGGANLQAQWVEGPPTFWFGGRVDLQGLEPVPIATFRCGGCGFLESYAPAK